MINVSVILKLRVGHNSGCCLMFAKQAEIVYVKSYDDCISGHLVMYNRNAAMHEDSRQYLHVHITYFQARQRAIDSTFSKPHMSVDDICDLILKSTAVASHRVCSAVAVCNLTILCGSHPRYVSSSLQAGLCEEDTFLNPHALNIACRVS